MCKIKMVRVTFNALTYLFGVQSFFRKIICYSQMRLTGNSLVPASILLVIEIPKLLLS